MLKINAVSGLVAGITSAISGAPADVVRSRIQVATLDKTAKNTVNIRNTIRAIWAEESLKGFFRGVSASLLIVPIAWGTYWPVYNSLK